MACCILAAFIIGHAAIAWRWVQTRMGHAPRAAAALWTPGTPAPKSSRKRRGTLLAAIMCIGVVSATGIGLVLQHASTPFVAWCRGATHD